MKPKNQPAIKEKSSTAKITLVIIVGFLFTFAFCSNDVYEIKDPTPTITEDKMAYLEEVHRIGVDLGNDEYLFLPKSIAADKSNVFIYDSAQKKVFRFSPDLKLIGSFGREGQGPGEFSGGKWVELSIGQDGNLYANDIQGFKIMGYTREGKLLKTFRYGTRSHMFKPVCDTHGNIIYAEMKDDTIKVKTDKDILLAQCKSERLHHSYLYQKTTDAFREECRLEPFIPLATWKLTGDSKLLLYFQTSSVLTIFDNDRQPKTIKLWPENALQDYKIRLKDFYNRKTKIKLPVKIIGSFMPMFGFLMVDQDDPNIFYLTFGSVQMEPMIYAFNLEGKLLKVIHFPTSSNNENPYENITKTHAKVNNTFYAIRNKEEVVLYKEK